MAVKEEIVLLPESVLTITADAVSNGRYVELPRVSGNDIQYAPINIGPNEEVVLGPFNDTRRYRLISQRGLLTYLIDFQGVDGVTTESVVNALSAANLELVLPENPDQILIKDSSDNGKLKAVTVQSIVDLIGGGGGAGSAITKTVIKASHGFNIGDVIALDNSGVYIKALTDDIITSEVVGVVSVVSSINEFTLTTSGYITGLSGLTPGCSHFASDLFAGTLQTTEPYLPNTVVKAVLVAETATTGYVMNYLGVHND
jgi:hypothetical protein